MSITVDTDPSRLDVGLVHRFLSTESTWARGIPRETVERAIRHSLCFGVYDGDMQVGFARVVTDTATHAWLCDVFVLDAHRGRGIARLLMDTVVAHPQLQGLRRFALATSTASWLYERYGFKPLAHPGIWMERHDPDAYA
ncbi:MAG TPA: GNAT family N-acetyltransferase [Albitalea sp.]|uniref:GNAT family N-acetyltransferase n=1 Tax=Piscinibacter sp. TaxID=1903157 RepID=UPI002ED33BDE